MFALRQLLVAWSLAVDLGRAEINGHSTMNVVNRFLYLRVSDPGCKIDCKKSVWGRRCRCVTKMRRLLSKNLFTKTSNPRTNRLSFPIRCWPLIVDIRGDGDEILISTLQDAYHTSIQAVHIVT